MNNNSIFLLFINQLCKEPVGLVFVIDVFTGRVVMDNGTVPIQLEITCNGTFHTIFILRLLACQFKGFHTVFRYHHCSNLSHMLKFQLIVSRWGFEPQPSEPESDILSVELPGHLAKGNMMLSLENHYIEEIEECNGSHTYNGHNEYPHRGPFVRFFIFLKGVGHTLHGHQMKVLHFLFEGLGFLDETQQSFFQSIKKGTHNKNS